MGERRHPFSVEPAARQRRVTVTDWLGQHVRCDLVFRSKESGEPVLLEAKFTTTNPDEPINARHLRSQSLAKAYARALAELSGLKHGPWVVEPPSRSRLTRPDGSDAWYQRFALIYIFHSVSSPTPAKDLAETSNLPVSAIYRWAGEARHRGHLPPARKGPKARPLLRGDT